MEHACQVDGNDAVPFVGIEIEKGGRLADARAVEQYVQPAELTYRGPHGSVDRGAVAHIEADRRGTACGGADARCGRFGPSHADIGTDHRRAFAPEPFCRRTPNT